MKNYQVIAAAKSQAQGIAKLHGGKARERCHRFAIPVAEHGVASQWPDTIALKKGFQGLCDILTGNDQRKNL